MTDADLVQAFWSAAIVAGFLLALLIPAFVVEWWRARGMRRRQRQRESLGRYCSSVDAQARLLARRCWTGPAGNQPR